MTSAKAAQASVAGARLNRAWASGPRLVAGAMFGNMVSANTVLTFTFGVFITTFHTTFGWSRADIALSMTCFTAVAFLGSSLIGRVAGRHSPRTLSAASMLAFGVGLMLVPWFIHSVQTLWAAYLLLAVIGLGTSPVVLNIPLVTAFSRRRGLAIALALTGSGIGGFALPQITAAFVAQGGWRYGFTGLGWLAVAGAPLVWIVLGKRSDASAASARAGHSSADRFRYRALSKSRVFWTLSLIALGGGLGMSGPAAHLIPLLGDEGIGPQAAARLAAIIGIASVVGRLLTGVVLDRFDTPVSAAPLIAVGAVGLLLLVRMDLATVALAIALLGFVIGSEVAILAYFISRYFALPAHATIFGWMYGTIAFGSAIGPVIVGALRDGQGTYGLGFTLSAGALGVASILCLLLGPYRYPTACAEYPDLAPKR